MKSKLFVLLVAAGSTLGLVLTGSAATRYVAITNAAPAYPYINWETAARVIQDAVDAADPGDEILVGDGMYATGGRAVDGMLTNRVVIDKPVIVRSLNGPESTVIKGYQVPGITNGDGAIRCVYLAPGAILSGFTITNGATRTSGNTWHQISGGGAYCEGTLTNCIVSGNAAYGHGGGIVGLANNCRFIGNSAINQGGGSFLSTLNNCQLIRNSSYWGGAASCSTLNNCSIIGNSGYYGGGTYDGTLNNCTLTGNTGQYGGGAWNGAANNCILYFNTALLAYENYGNVTLNYCCTTPLPSSGVNNIATDPQMASASHLSANSPCLGAGNAAYATGTDIDGDAWASPPAIGCDEYRPGAATGPLSVSMVAVNTNVVTGIAVEFSALIQGRCSGTVWDFADGVLVSNLFFVSHTWTNPGDYLVVLKAFNDSYPEGVSAERAIHVIVPPVHYVAIDSTNPVPPYKSWATAAQNIQPAIDVAIPGSVVLVSNGVYEMGGRAVDGIMTNRVVVDKVMTVCSLNGPATTVIKGYQVHGTTNGDGAIRCVYLTNGAVLRGFTLTNGATLKTDDMLKSSGGAVCLNFPFKQAIVSNCVLVGNSGYWGGGVSGASLYNCTVTGNSAQWGGGIYQGHANNCIVSNNWAYNGGGGACFGSLDNSLLVGNSAYGTYGGGGAAWSAMNNCTISANMAKAGGGGICGGTLSNCIVYYNMATNSPNWWSPDFAFSLNYCCTLPEPTNGAGNITNPPLFLDSTGGNFRLQSGSYCIDAGNNTCATNLADLDGNPRIVGGTVDMGAYEFQTPFHYVDASSATPIAPYKTWATAAHNIQDAVDAAVPGDEIIVTNGVYGTGGRVAEGLLTNRVSINKPISVRSVNGPAVTIIQGYQVPGTTNGENAIRPVYLTNGASLIGFTITNGATKAYYYPSLDSLGGGILAYSNSVISNCIIVGNSAEWIGGGVVKGQLDHCILTNNSVSFMGGGAAMSHLTDCTISGNFASRGGGVEESTLVNCRLLGNAAWQDVGGGAFQSTLKNCLISENWAAYGAGGVAGGTLNNCTLTGNSTGKEGGGAVGSTLNNCIVYFNKATEDENYSHCIMNYCCTRPLPPSGVLNFTADPQFASPSHLSPSSPCRGTGSSTYVTGTDLDGEPWANPPSIGCDEYWPGAFTGPLSVAIASDYSYVSVGFGIDFKSLISGRSSGNAWDFGDGVVVSNQLAANHIWSSPGEFPVILRVFNDDYPDGVSATTRVSVVVSPIYYVALESTNPVAPYASWETAANDIQAAVDVASVPGATVLVSNGVYLAGGRAVEGLMTNRLTVDKPVSVISINGPTFTVIEGFKLPGSITGEGAIRCVYLTNGAVLSGFTVTNGATVLGGFGGGIWCASHEAVVSNCVIVANAADTGGGGVCSGTIYNCSISNNSASVGAGAALANIYNSTVAYNIADRGGGGTYQGILNNCIVIGNMCGEKGGGAWQGILNNCTVVDNSAYALGGGAHGSVMNNCITGYNSAWEGPNHWDSILNYCCTTPLPETGRGNIDNFPDFIDYPNRNLYLNIHSPCINSGNNAYVIDSTRPIVGGTVDIGAYECTLPLSLISFAWLHRYGLDTDGSSDFVDSDGDGMNNYQEWTGGTDPRNAGSVLRLLGPVPSGNNVMVRWESVSGVNYFLERSTNLFATPPFQPLATNLLGQPGISSFSDTNPAQGQLFYRIGVGN